MKIVVTGGAGFIGSCLVWKLNSEGIDDIIVVDNLGSTDKWKNLIGKKIEDYIEKDKFLDYLESGKLKPGIDTILHMGACSSTTEKDASYLIENNYIYSKKLCQWALKNKVRFLYASSAATYGNGECGYSDDDKSALKLRPLNMYGFSKHLFDLWLIKHGLNKKVTGFKFFNVFGANEYHKQEMRSVICKVYDKVSTGAKFRLFKSYRKDYPDGGQKRDFVYIKDAVEVVNYFFKNPAKTGIFNLGTGQARTWNDLASALFSALKMKPNIEYIDMPADLRDKYQYYTQADMAKLRKAGCKHKFFSLEDAIKDYSLYLKDHAYL